MLNINIPPIEGYARAEYMRQHRDGHGTVYPCVVFGMASIPGQAPLFHFLLEDGGIWWRAPVSAFCVTRDAPHVDLHELCLWDSFSYHPSVTRFDFLANKKMRYRSRAGHDVWGRYLFTLDWCAPDGSGFAETAGQHKCGHVIERDDGNIAIQPNNRVLLFEPSYVTQFGKPVLDRLVSDRIYTVEDQARYRLANSEAYDTAMVADPRLDRHGLADSLADDGLFNSRADNQPES